MCPIRGLPTSPFASCFSAFILGKNIRTAKMSSMLAISVFAAAFAWSAHGQNSDAIPPGIEKLHHDDITATIAGDVDALTALLDDDAVLLQPGIPPIVGKVDF